MKLSGNTTNKLNTLSGLKRSFWRFAVQSTTAPSSRYVSVTSNDYGKRKNYRMLSSTLSEACTLSPEKC
jgi:hypothetical protein